MCGALYLRLVVGIGPNASSELFKLVTTQYAPYVGAILGFHFAAKSSGRIETRAKKLPYLLALITSGLWNLIMISLLIQACLNSDRTQDTLADIRLIIPNLSWILAPAIAFFFGQP